MRSSSGSFSSTGAAARRWAACAGSSSRRTPISALVEIIAVTLKELRELLQRPTLVLTLIFGPLLVMLIFGIGSNIVYPLPRTAVVLPPGEESSPLIQDYRDQLRKYVQVTEYTQDLESVREKLRRNQIDAVMILPGRPYETLAQGRQVRVRMLYNQIDPTRSWLVPNYASTMEGEINRTILLQGAGQQQRVLAAAEQRVDAALDTIDTANRLQSGGNRLTALERVREARGLTSGLVQLLDQLGPNAGALVPAVDTARDRLQDTDEQLRQAQDALSMAGGPVDLTQARADLQTLKDALERYSGLPPEVVVSPLDVRAEYVGSIQPNVIVFFAPALLALLIQHTAVSLGSLSLVRERLAGTFDLYTVAPISAFQILIGKYLANLLFTGVIAAVLLGALINYFGVPILGDPVWVLVTIMTLALTSVGLGFLLSLLASSERQAVQFAMLFLLGVVFFSGFALPVESLTQPATTVSYMMPATYGSNLLQDVMLRGLPGNDLFYTVLGGLSAVLFIACLLLLRWRMRSA
jgi:ABC-2 type transport system permease protein